MVCYYYCDYADSASLEPIRLVASLIKQVLERLPLDHFDEDFQSPFQEGSPMPLLRVAWDYLVKSLEEFGEVYLILDGIDELDHDGQSKLLELLVLLLDSSDTVFKVFLNSRPEEYRIKRAMKAHLNFQISVAHVEHDIALFVADEIRQLETPHPLVDDGDLKQEVIRLLTARAHGI
jgi:hypothetical protein